MKTPNRARQTVAIIGTGLIGASVGLALRARRRGAPHIVGWDARRTALDRALSMRAIVERANSLEEAVQRAGIVVIAAPLDAILQSLPRVIAVARRGALIIEVGAVKKPVIAAARSALRSRPDVLFVGGHPMAGRAIAGPANADRALFAGRPFALVVPNQPRKAQAAKAALQFAVALGARPVRLTAVEHDRLIAATSALPQLASIALALAVDAAAGAKARSLAGPGYDDATRLAGSPFHIWGPALAANGAAVRRALRALARSLRRLQTVVERGDDEALSQAFSRAATARRRVVGD